MKTRPHFLRLRQAGVLVGVFVFGIGGSYVGRVVPAFGHGIELTAKSGFSPYAQIVLVDDLAHADHGVSRGRLGLLHDLFVIDPYIGLDRDIAFAAPHYWFLGHLMCRPSRNSGLQRNRTAADFGGYINDSRWRRADIEINNLRPDRRVISALVDHIEHQPDRMNGDLGPMRRNELITGEVDGLARQPGLNAAHYGEYDSKGCDNNGCGGSSGIGRHWDWFTTFIVGGGLLAFAAVYAGILFCIARDRR